jgi:oligopeptide transport system substrate-binding protein
MTPCAAPSRRDVVLAAAAAAGAAFSLSGCGTAHRRPDCLTYLLRGEPYTLDPARSAGGAEGWILSALLEPLLEQHPETTEPIAGLATHYLVDGKGTRFTFYLRGHPAPKGIRLAGAESLPAEFTRARQGSAFDEPARWSDGVPVTADDVVFSWRRYLAPETAYPSAYTLSYIDGAEAVNAGKLAPDNLGVRVIDAFSFEVNLRAPAPDFLKVCSSMLTVPMPRHAIEAARRRGRESSWTDPGEMVSSGPFVLRESRLRELVVLSRNPAYFDAPLVGVEEIQFAPADGAMVVNLFEAGLADSMDGRVLPLQLAPRLRGRPGLHVLPACANHNWRISANRAPLDNVILRYALNMATDKEATARFLGSGQQPAKTRVPPLAGYQSPRSLAVELNGRSCDVLAYHPRTARELWARECRAGAQKPLQVNFFARQDSFLLAEILQQQWRANLGVETVLHPRDTPSFIQTILTEGNFTGVAEDSYMANYADPFDLLSLYLSGYASWADPEYDRTLAAATSLADSATRMTKLSACEERLLHGMPFIPLYFDNWVYLERPEVHGLRLNLLGVPSFKFAWIDQNRRVQ